MRFAEDPMRQMKKVFGPWFGHETSKLLHPCADGCCGVLSRKGRAGDLSVY